jgi:hypothetical protein
MLLIQSQSRADAADQLASLRERHVDVTIVPVSVFDRIREDMGIDTGRNDAAGDTMYLARELEWVSAQTYDVLTDPIVGRKVLPLDYSFPEGAESYTYHMYEGTADVDWITNWSSPVGGATASKFPTTFQSFSLGGMYEFTDEDLARAAFAASKGAGRALSTEKARFNRIGHEQKLDDLIAVGDSARGIKGITNHSSIPIVAPAVGTWDSATTPAEIFQDLAKLCQAPEQATAGNFVADTLVLPLSMKPLLTGKPYSDTIPDSVLSVWLKSQENIKTVLFWKRLNTASTGSPSGGPRALAFKKDPMVVSFLLAYDYREKAPQVHVRATQIHTTMKIVGVVLRYALACAYMDLDESP